MSLVLAGKLPPWTGSGSLTTLALEGNRLTGPLPLEFPAMSQLQTLTLHQNNLTGCAAFQFVAGLRLPVITQCSACCIMHSQVLSQLCAMRVA